MSALLPVNDKIKELDVFVEPGYASRTFDRNAPNVKTYSDYKTALFMVHTNDKLLPNRRDPYYNHFALYSNEKSLIIVRTETSLIWKDHDAALVFDTITPLHDTGRCYRTSCVDDNWVVSCDEIGYSNKKPATFATYSLICYGEWWYFDAGVCLNGISSYKKGKRCYSIFVYFELLPRLRVMKNAMRNNIMHNLTPHSENLTNRFVASTPNRFPTSSMNNRNNDGGTMTDVAAVAAAASAVERTEQQQHQPVVAATAAPPTSVLINSMFSNNATALTNAAARPSVRSNDESNIANSGTRLKHVIPSLYWFDERHRELLDLRIEYFVPKH